MMLRLEKLIGMMLKGSGVKGAYEAMEPGFAFLDELRRALQEAGLRQAQVWGGEAYGNEGPGCDAAGIGAGERKTLAFGGNISEVRQGGV